MENKKKNTLVVISSIVGIAALNFLITFFTTTLSSSFNKVQKIDGIVTDVGEISKTVGKIDSMTQDTNDSVKEIKTYLNIKFGANIQ